MHKIGSFHSLFYTLNSWRAWLSRVTRIGFCRKGDRDSRQGRRRWVGRVGNCRISIRGGRLTPPPTHTHITAWPSSFRYLHLPTPLPEFCRIFLISKRSIYTANRSIRKWTSLKFHVVICDFLKITQGDLSSCFKPSSAYQSD